MLRLDGKTAIITGSARGIGAEIAALFAQQGANVVVSDVNEPDGEETVRTLAAKGARTIFVRCDVTDRSQVKQLMEKAAGEFGRIDILVNNAGFNKDYNITEMEENVWDAVMDVCLKGTFNCCQAAVPYMQQQQYGKIVNISSRAWWGNPGQVNYSAAKAGIVGLTRALSKELGKANINVNAVAPGFTETDLVRAHPKYDMIREMAIKAQPIKRTGTPADQAQAVLFLASDEAGFISGEVLHVTGGRFS